MAETLTGDNKMEESMGVLLSAILAIEGWRGPGTKGAAGEIGPYQITYGYWVDSGMPGKFIQCEDKEYSEQVVGRYWKRYCPGAWLDRDVRVLAAVHHFGPKGARMKSYTDDYVKRVENIVRGRRSNDLITQGQ